MKILIVLSNGPNQSYFSCFPSAEDKFFVERDFCIDLQNQLLRTHAVAQINVTIHDDENYSNIPMDYVT